MVMMRKRQQRAIRIFNRARARKTVSIISPNVPLLEFPLLIFDSVQSNDGMKAGSI